MRWNETQLGWESVAGFVGLQGLFPSRGSAFLICKMISDSVLSSPVVGYCPQLRLSPQLLPFQGAMPTAPGWDTAPPTTRGAGAHHCSSCQSGCPVPNQQTSWAWGPVFPVPVVVFSWMAGLLFINFLCLYACCPGGGWARCSSSSLLTSDA